MSTCEYVVYCMTVYDCMSMNTLYTVLLGGDLTARPEIQR